MSVAAYSTRVPREESKITFLRVSGEDSGGMSTISEIFRRILVPLYGSQERALEQIRQGIDRSAYLLYEDTAPVGVLVFKNQPTQEFQEAGVSNSVEIKSLFVDHATQNSGKGLGSRLLTKLYEELKNRSLNEDGIHVTVSETRQESLQFFQKKHFQIVDSWKGKYQPDVTEYLLSCPHRIREQAMASLRTALLPHGIVFEILKAHFDSIHALIKGPNDTFISASKDCSLFLWDHSGEKKRTFFEGEPTLNNEERWVTALTNVADRYVISGHRNGELNLWTMQGDYLRNIPTAPSTVPHKSNPLNYNRITCLATGRDPNIPSVFIGSPTKFEEYNFVEQRIEHTVKVHNNDWCYCLQPLRADLLLTIQGGSGHLWRKDPTSWQHLDTVIPEGDRYLDEATNKWQRPFISSLTQVGENQAHFATTLFSGAVNVIDIEQKQIVNEWKEHKGRVWQSAFLSDGRLASGGDDQTVRLYDIRSKETKTISGFPAPVQALLNTKEHTLIAGCARDNAGNGAMIRALDLRV